MIAAPSKGANRNLLKSKPSNRHSRRACPRMYLSGVFSGNPYFMTGCPIEPFGHDNSENQNIYSGTKHNPVNVKLCESPSKAGGLPIVKLFFPVPL